MERKKINGEEFPKSKLRGLIAMFDDNPVRSAVFMADFEDLYNKGVDLNPDCNVWYRVKPDVIDLVDELDISEEGKTTLKKKISDLIGAPVFHVGEKAKTDSLIVAGLVEGKLIGFDKKYFYKIKSKPYMKKLKKALFVSASWEEFIKPLIYTIRGFGLDKCASFPSIEAKRSDEEED
jgi:hypothetical protein